MIRNSKLELYSNGQPMTRCVLHEINPTTKTAEAALTVGGMSVCMEHFSVVANWLADGKTVGSLLKVEQNAVGNFGFDQSEFNPTLHDDTFFENFDIDSNRTAWPIYDN